MLEVSNFWWNNIFLKNTEGSFPGVSSNLLNLKMNLCFYNVLLYQIYNTDLKSRDVKNNHTALAKLQITVEDCNDNSPKFDTGTVVILRFHRDN